MKHAGLSEEWVLASILASDEYFSRDVVTAPIGVIEGGEKD